MLNIRLFACASVHDQWFTDISRKRQCNFTSLLALLCEQVFVVQLWTSRAVDDTVILLRTIC